MAITITISITILSILLSSLSCTAQSSQNQNKIGDDQTNWAEMWNVLSQSNNGRSAVADSRRPSLFDIILKANAAARRTSRARSGETEFLFQGDIAVNKREVLGILDRGKGRKKRAVMKKLAARLWQRSKLSYVISNDLGKFTRQIILTAIKQWEDTLPCMGKWKDRNEVDSAKRPRDYIRFIKGEGCYSRVGRQGGRQVISIGTGCEQIGVVVHEIGHAMGFWHEQSRTDRDTYINIHWENIIPAMKFNFEKYTASRINDLGVDYDYDSVMHYGAKAFSKNGRSTISVKKGKAMSGSEIGQRYSLSEKDKKQARLLYNCITKPLPCSSSPCLNRGVCTNNGKKFSCRCTSDYTGERCEKKISNPCSSYPCLNGGACKNNRDKYTCTCASGYTGLRCEKKNVCVNKNPRCGEWAKGGYCSPEKGYEHYMKETCCRACRQKTTITPCSSSPCLNRGTCKNNGDKYSCSCTSGYTGTRCEAKVTPCSSSPCLNGGKCRNNGDKYSCSCTSGYTGNRCELRVTLSCTKNLRSTGCDLWKTYCINYSSNGYYSFMKNNCCKTCKEYCKDKHQHCKQWSASFCHLKKYEKFMRNNCPIACGYDC